MIWYYQYPVISVEVGVLGLGATLVAVLLSRALYRLGSLVINLTIICGLAGASLIQFNLLFVGFMAVLLSSSLLAALLKRHFPNLVLAILAAMTIGAWLDSGANPATRLQELPRRSTPPATGPVVHILMDGFIGPDGLPNGAQAQSLRSDILRFFEDHGFTLYTRAYSHYATTVDSMARALNFRNDAENMFQRNALQRVSVSFRENAWFTALDNAGYQLVVYQTTSIDYCSTPLSQEIVCNVFPIPNLRTLHTDLDAPLTRSWVLLQTLWNRSVIITKLLKDYGLIELGTWGVSLYDERKLPRMARDIRKQPGNAYFAHVLIPHAPSVYGSDCSIDYESEPWTRWPHSGGEISNSDETRAVRYAKIFPQMQCALRTLERFFDELKSQGVFDDASIIVHSDHGSSAFRTRPSAHLVRQLSYQDLKDAFSILFAVKLPGTPPDRHDEVVSLNVLMARTAGAITGMTAASLNAEVTSEPEPFIYLTDAFPLRRIDVEPFNPRGSGAEIE